MSATTIELAGTHQVSGPYTLATSGELSRLWALCLASSHGLVRVRTVQVEHPVTEVEPPCHRAGGAAYERHKREWRPSPTSEHPAARETYSNSGGTATHQPDHSNQDQLSEAKAVAK